MRFTMMIERDGEEIEVEIEATYYRGSRGHCDKYGAPEEPDDPPEIGIGTVTGPDGKEVELTDAELSRAEWKAREAMED